MSKGVAGFRGHLLTVIAFAAITVGFMVLILSKSGVLPTLGHKYEVKAKVPSASLLAAGARVTMAGADVGRVTGVERAGEFSSDALVTIELTDERVTPLARDSRVQIRTRSQVGENYLAVVAGRDDATIPDGGSIGLDQADEVVSVDQILSVLQGRTRERARTLLQEFGASLDGKGEELNRTLRGVNATIDDGVTLVEIVDRNRATVAALVDQLGEVAAAVGERGAAIETISRQATISLRAVANQDAALRETLRELPATLDQVGAASQTVGSVSDEASPVVARLTSAANDLAPAVRDLAPASRSGRELLGAVDGALPDLRALAQGGASLRGPFIGSIPHIEQTLCELNPALRYVLPYRRDLLDLPFHLSGASHAYDATGHTVRLMPLLSENSVSGAPPEVLAATQLLLQSGPFFPLRGITYDPYMEPGEIGTTVARPGEPTTIAELRDSGFEYPRVRADC